MRLSPAAVVGTGEKKIAVASVWKCSGLLKWSGLIKWSGKLSLQFIVTPEGENGLTLEHSPTDGVAVASMADFIVAKIRNDQEQVFFRPGFFKSVAVE
jgi:Choline/Carnitine o-acyltransferase